MRNRLFRRDREGRQLVAVAGADGNAVTALGAAARQYGGSGLGLHTGAKAVDLRTVTAIRLKRALRHGTALLNFFYGKCCPADTEENATSRQRLSISDSRGSRKKGA